MVRDLSLPLTSYKSSGHKLEAAVKLPQFDTKLAGSLASSPPRSIRIAPPRFNSLTSMVRHTRGRTSLLAVVISLVNCRTPWLEGRQVLGPPDVVNVQQSPTILDQLN